VAHPARYFWTPAAQPWFFPGADDDAIGNWEDVGTDDDELLAAIPHPTYMVLYKRRSIWRVSGDPANLQVFAQRTNANMGIVGPDAAVAAGGIDYIVSTEGVYIFNGDSEELISAESSSSFRLPETPLFHRSIFSRWIKSRWP
jgi:hypothetical protein